MILYTRREEWYPVHVPSTSSDSGAEQWEVPEELAFRYMKAFNEFDAVSDELVDYYERQQNGGNQ